MRLALLATLVCMAAHELPQASKEQSSRAKPRSNSAEEAKKPEPRPYSEGRLSERDFAAAIPAGQIIQASTYTSIDFNYRYRMIAQGSGVQLVASQIFTQASVDPARSWNKTPGDLRLLDHEQGHFDITQLYTLRWRARFETLMRQGVLKASGPTEKAAYDVLQSIVQKEFQELFKTWEAEQREYDNQTNHGLDRKRQDEWRKRLDEQLQEARSPQAKKS
jgi:hypothetical protein